MPNKTYDNGYTGNPKTVTHWLPSYRRLQEHGEH